MFRRYAIFATNHPLSHAINILIVSLIMLFSIYQVVEQEMLIYSNGIAFSLICILVFSRASDYKRKYLNQR